MNTFDGFVRGDQFKEEERHRPPACRGFPSIFIRKKKKAKFHDETTGPTFDTCLSLSLSFWEWNVI